MKHSSASERWNHHSHLFYLLKWQPPNSKDSREKKLQSPDLHKHVLLQGTFQAIPIQQRQMEPLYLICNKENWGKGSFVLGNT